MKMTIDQAKKDKAIDTLKEKGVKIPKKGVEFHLQKTRFRDGHEVTQLIVSWPGQNHRLSYEEEESS